MSLYACVLVLALGCGGDDGGKSPDDGGSGGQGGSADSTGGTGGSRDSGASDSGFSGDSGGTAGTGGVGGTGDADSGGVSGSDAGGTSGSVDAGGGCHPNPDPDNEVCTEICPELCNDRDDDCDRRIDEDAGDDCELPNAIALCVAGECFVDACEGDFRDCDGDGSNGCEVSIATDVDNCGGCGMKCALDNVDALTCGGVLRCLVVTCAEGFGNCDGQHANGCEADIGTGSCNCASGSVDTDGDGTPDCNDDCPNDPAKTSVGACDCGTADDDTDGDGTPDCDDGCPSDPAKTSPGPCGCGIDASMADDCSALSAALRHRYRFDGGGSTAVDSVSGADGSVINATLDASSAVALAGDTSDQYVDLPNGIVSALTDATFEVWLDWQGGASWQRILDFGDSTSGEGMQGSGTSYVFLTAQDDGGNMRAAVSLNGPGSESNLIRSGALATGGVHHVALVIDDQNEMRLYVDGMLEGMGAVSDSLSNITDVNNWIGRSQYSADPELGATVHEFRIYDAALSDAEVASSFMLGSDPAFLDP